MTRFSKGEKVLVTGTYRGYVMEITAVRNGVAYIDNKPFPCRYDANSGDCLDYWPPFRINKWEQQQLVVSEKTEAL